jgi:ribosomal-protein-alanine N-acetyltransferase
MQTTYTTARLNLNPITLNDDKFILTLLNSPGWLRFIGDRNVKNTDEARAYITNIIDSKQFIYWVVKLIDAGEPIGVITCITRNYLPYPDIGFAFLPAYASLGYAFEAASTVINGLVNENNNSTFLAITLRDNAGSISLLKKLGFDFERNIETNGEMLEVWQLHK